MEYTSDCLYMMEYTGDCLWKESRRHEHSSWRRHWVVLSDSRSHGWQADWGGERVGGGGEEEEEEECFSTDLMRKIWTCVYMITPTCVYIITSRCVYIITFLWFLDRGACRVAVSFLTLTVGFLTLTVGFITLAVSFITYASCRVGMRMRQVKPYFILRAVGVFWHLQQFGTSVLASDVPQAY